MDIYPFKICGSGYDIISEKSGYDPFLRAPLHKSNNILDHIEYLTKTKRRISSDHCDSFPKFWRWNLDPLLPCTHTKLGLIKLLKPAILNGVKNILQFFLHVLSRVVSVVKLQLILGTFRLRINDGEPFPYIALWEPRPFGGKRGKQMPSTAQSKLCYLWIKTHLQCCVWIIIVLSTQ